MIVDNLSINYIEKLIKMDRLDFEYKKLYSVKIKTNLIKQYGNIHAFKNIKHMNINKSIKEINDDKNEEEVSSEEEEEIE